MVPGILGRKRGMTTVFTPDGAALPVTVIEAGPCFVTQLRTPENEGYSAVQVGFEEAKRLTKPERGHLKGLPSLRHLREFRLEGQTAPAVGDKIDVSIFQPGDFVDVIGTSKGKGFAGVVKRHHFAGGPKSHGSMFQITGSIGSSAFPSRVFRGMRMSGHMGNARVTTRNLKVVGIDLDDNLLMVEGAVPGPNGGYVVINKSVKPPRERRGFGGEATIDPLKASKRKTKKA